MDELNFTFKMPDDETLAKYISIKGEKGEAGDPTKLSQLENDTGFVTASTDALTNYYTKAQTDSAIDADVAALKTELGVPDGFFTDESETASGEGTIITLSGTSSSAFKDTKLYGDTQQDGSPTPDNPVDIEVVTGDQTIVFSDGDQQGQNFTVSLGDIQLCGFGDYKDYIYKGANGFYIHKAINSKTFNASSTHSVNVASTNTARLVFSGGLSGATPISLSNSSPTIGASNVSIAAASYNWTSDAVGFRYSTNGNAWWRLSKSIVGSTSEEVEEWLESQSIVIYYPLGTPVETLITDVTLISQLEELWKAKSYNGTTIITVSGSLASPLSIVAFKGNWKGTTSGIDFQLSRLEDETSGVSRKPYCFDSVAEMKAYSLKVGDIAITTGYYSHNDGGAGKYKVTAGELTPDNGSVIQLDNGLQASLIVENGFVNVKQFGAKGDDTTDDTQAFINALAFCPRLEIPTATYRVIIVNFPANAIVNGKNSIINSLRPAGDLRLNAFGNNSTINDLTVNSLNEDLAWNRIDIANEHDITFNNCKFSGFRDQSTVQNAWAFFMKSSQRVVFNKCYFENNNFQDILIEIGCKDIVFNDCDGDHFFIDIEPGQNSTDLVECVTFNRCNIFRVHLYENFLTTTQIRNVTFNDCKIATVIYDGATAGFNNCIITDWGNQTTGEQNTLFAGMAEFNQSLNLGEDLIKDNYFDSVCLSNTKSWWFVSYSEGISYRTGLTSIREDDTNYIVLNPENRTGVIFVTTPNIPASGAETYLLRFSGKAQYPSNASWISNIGTIRFYDSNDSLLETDTISAFRSVKDSSTPRITQNAIIVCPANTSYFNVTFRNGRGGGVSKLYLENCQLFKLNARNEYSNEIPTLAKRRYRKFHSDSIPTDSGNYNVYHVGDEMMFNDPATAGYIGAICTAEATEGHYVGTWKKYGALES